MSDNPVDPQQAVDDARRALYEAEAEAASIADDEPIDDAQPIEDAQEAPSPASKHCANCGRHVVPSPRGSCPTCGRILPGAVFNRKGPVSLVRRDEILTQILDEYKPRTVVHRLRCLHLASAYAQLETTTAGTTEFQRLIADSQKLVAELDATRKTDGAASSANIETLSSEQLIARLETLLAAAREAQLKPEPAEPAASQPDAASEDQSEAARAIFAAGADSTSAEKESAAPSPSVIRHLDTDNSIHEQRRLDAQAAQRKELGWDKGVWNERTGYRHRE